MESATKTIRVPLVADYTIRRFTTTTVDEYYGMSNLVVEEDTAGPEKRLMAVTRPILRRHMNNTTGKTKGRGIYFWEETGNLLVVNDNTVYSLLANDDTLGAGDAIGTITSGTDRVYFTQVGNSLLMVDPVNNQGWIITTAGTVTQITDADFPTALAHGAVTLNGRGYVIDTSGVIYNSALDDATSWEPLDFTEAEREPDKGILITKHHDHVVVLGSTTVEFFYDNANPSGSLLSRRTDVFYNTGGIAGQSTCVAGDVLYFLGDGGKGALAIYKLENFKLSRVSTTSIDGWYTDLICTQGRKILLTGFGARGGFYLLTTQYDGTTVNTGTLTIAYDSRSTFWQTFSTTLSGCFTTAGAGLSVSDWTGNNGVYTNTTGSSFGITAQGSVVSVTNNRSGGGGLQDGAIVQSVLTRHTDGGSFKYKYCRSIRIVGDVPVNTTDGTVAEVTFSLSWSNNIFSSFSSAISLSISGDDNNFGTNITRATRCGRFRRRSFQLSTGADEVYRLEALELEVALGDV